MCSLQIIRSLTARSARRCSQAKGDERMLAEGYQVLGVSKDSQKSHLNFIAKYELPFTLLSDPSTEMLQAFGAWGEKKMCGKTCIGTLRKTFVFDEKGILTQVIEKVDTKNHAEQILGES